MTRNAKINSLDDFQGKSFAVLLKVDLKDSFRFCTIGKTDHKKTQLDKEISGSRWTSWC